MSLSFLDTPLARRIPSPPRREARWNPALLPAVIAAPGVDALLRRLSEPGALVVTTGQQPGLFGGPGYAITKALSARALAAGLERAWGQPVLAVYWVPGDDHDFDEVNHAAWLGSDGDLVRRALPGRRPDAPLTPMYREPLGVAIGSILDAFEGSFADQATSGSTVAWLRRHYRPDATVAGAYGSALAELLAPLGILCLDSTHAAVKTAAAPVLREGLFRCEALERGLVAKAAELSGRGIDAGVAVGDGAALVFVETKDGRDRLVRDGERFHTRRGKESFTLAELERMLAAEPTRFSGNVLLRPVIESAVLPTVGYVAGPGELKYLELAAPLYAELGVPRQQPVPRWSGLLVEPRVTRVLSKFGAGLPDLLGGGNALETRIARAALPAGTEAAIASLRTAISAGYDPLVRAAMAVDPTLERPARAREAQALFGLERLEKRLLQHARRREAVELAQVARARLSVAPEGKPQERVLALTGFLARYGDALLSSWAEHIDTWYRHALEAGSGPA